MKSWQPNHVVLSDEPVLLDTDVAEVDPEMFKACNTANFWIEKIVENKDCRDDPDVLEFF
jgi:uncharacterized protein YwqG